MITIFSLILISESFVFEDFLDGSLSELQFLGYSEENLVSTDFLSDNRTSILDANSGIEIGPSFFKIISWYDNEWGYSKKLIDLLQHIK